MPSWQIFITSLCNSMCNGTQNVIQDIILLNHPLLLLRKIHLNMHFLITNSMLSPSSTEANMFSLKKRISWNYDFHYSVHNSPTFDPFLSRINQEHTFPSILFFKIYFTIVLPPIPMSSKLFLSFRFPHLGPTWV